MTVRLAIASLCCAMASRAVQPTPGTAILPFAAFGTMDNDLAAARESTPRRHKY